MKTRLTLLWIGSLVSVFANASDVTWGAFVDVYGAYDFNRPPSVDRAFTTQAARDREFNVNLVYVEAKLERAKVHGRLALQAGTSVQSNTAGEPTIGSVSGPSLSRNVQEAYAGYRLGERTWIDAGVMFSHIGLESFVSKDNATYTRSLVAEYSPYYQAGARLTTQFSDEVSGQLLLLNGWQNISESNSGKAVGTQLVYAMSPALSLTYNTFFGREGPGFRHFHDLILKFAPSEGWSLAAQADLGFQERGALGLADAGWRGFALIARRVLTPRFALAGRLEHYSDPEQVLAVSATGAALRAWGASIGVDTELDPGIAWRNEVRGLWADAPVFPAHDGAQARDVVLVTALSAAF